MIVITFVSNVDSDNVLFVVKTRKLSHIQFRLFSLSNTNLFISTHNNEIQGKVLDQFGHCCAICSIFYVLNCVAYV